MQIENITDINELINNFIEKYEQGIVGIYKTYNDDCTFSIENIKIELFDKLKNEYCDFLKNKKSQDIEYFLFYIINEFYKKKYSIITKKKITEYLCPGCLFLKNNKILLISNGMFKCINCEKQFEQSNDRGEMCLFKTFAIHNKYGYRCSDCNRFIPHPMNNSLIISCPYLDCCFVGELSLLKKMNHPTNKYNNENLLSEYNPYIINDNINVLKNVINSQISSISYSSSEFTVNNKICCYQAFLNLLDKFPTEMVDYLINNSRKGGFQQKIFQEYIKLLEISLPYSYRKNNKIYKIKSLLDEQLSLFDGISIFDGLVSDKLEIKNNTREFYIGGRKAAYTKPFYIGKLLEICDKTTTNSLLNNVKEYGFSKIKMKDIVPGTEVIVTHLRIPPHYQMGGMVYVNRLKKRIIEQTVEILNHNV